MSRIQYFIQNPLQLLYMLPALLLGLTGDDPAFEGGEWPGESTKVKVAVDCFGPADLVGIVNSRPNMPLDDTSLFYALGGKNEQWKENLAKISPVNYIVPGRELPPFLLLHGDADDVVDIAESEVTYQKLLDNGYEADLVRVTGAPHEGNFWSQELLEIVFEFIQKHI